MMIECAELNARIQQEDRLFEFDTDIQPIRRVLTHLDGNNQNNCLNNLKWGTHKENAEDRIKHGNWKVARGENSGTSVLNESKVREIKSLVNDHSDGEIARKFEVCPETIRKIRLSITWRHVA